MPKPPKDLRRFESLLKVVEDLRGPDGCPWDKEQTFATLTRFAIEEAHELAEAIDSEDINAFRDELGDFLLQVVLHSEIARQAGLFDIYDVIEGISAKMVRRHPHVFSDAKVNSSSEVLANWSQIKAQEKASKKSDSSNAAKISDAFDIPLGLPALLRAHKVGEKTKKLAFDWDSSEQCWKKVEEEFSELLEVIQQKPLVNERAEEEFGDLLFSLVQWGRHSGIDSEQALRKTNQRFIKRFNKMQELVRAAGLDWSTLPPPEKERLWKEAKCL